MTTAREADDLGPPEVTSACDADDLVPPRRRSCLAVPASARRMLDKARATLADEFVIDLEDAVAASVKEVARDGVVSHLTSADWTGRTVAVRVNAPGTPWCHLDVSALAGISPLPRSIVVPKVQNAGDIAFVDRLLEGAEAAADRPRPVRVQALIETASAIAHVGEIAAASPRLEALILGYADLAASLGRRKAGAASLDLWAPAQHDLLCAARAHGLQAIDGPYFRTADDAGFRETAVRARELGFDGKWAIHPSQLETLNELFSPTADELEHARRVVEALDAADSQRGVGAVTLDGQMIDNAMREAAFRTLAAAPSDLAPA
jgi:citrate lyase subunit beta/citryl-CoA lyase